MSGTAGYPGDREALEAVGVRDRERARTQTARAKKRNDVAGIRP